MRDQTLLVLMSVGYHDVMLEGGVRDMRSSDEATSSSAISM